MAHVQFTDEVIKEYLLYRGFSGTLKAFDNELKVEKDKGFRVDKIVESLLQSVYNYDLAGLRDAWGHLESKIFTKLDHHQVIASKKLESALLKFYLVHAVENSKSDKVSEFFSKMTADLSGQADWKDWFPIPYVKYPEENPMFAVYFTRQWQDSLFVSLHNFLAFVYQNLPLPTLAAYEESTTKLATLQKENDMLRRGLANLLAPDAGKSPEHPDDLSDIMDDFYNISLEVKAAEIQAKTLKSLTKSNASSSTVSPKSLPSSSTAARKPLLKKITASKRSSSSDARGATERRVRDSSLDPAVVRPQGPTKALVQPKGSFLFLSQDEYNEHASSIKRLKLNSRGNMVASLDVTGGLRVWTTPPSCRTVAVFPSRPQADLLEWVVHNERYLLSADPCGPLRLLDYKEVHQVWEIPVTIENGAKLDDIISNPAESSALILANGKVFLLDLKSKKIEKCLNVTGTVTSCAFSLNGQIAFCGCEDGSVQTIDLQKNEVKDALPSLSSRILYVHLTIDGSYCFYLSSSRQLRWLSLQKKEHAQTLTFPSECQLSSTRNRSFCLDSSGIFLLTMGSKSGVIYKISEEGMSECLKLGGHKFEVTCIDWSFANQCATCVTASSDGNIRISTLLIDNITM